MKEQEQWPDWTDAVGNVFKVGDTVLYAQAYNGSANVSVGVVVKINKRNSKGALIEEDVRSWNPKTKMYGGTIQPSCTIALDLSKDQNGKYLTNVRAVRNVFKVILDRTI